MKFQILLYTLAIVLFSCNSKDKNSKEEQKKQEEEYITKITAELASEYNIVYKWDTLDYAFSIDYKSVINSKHQLIENIEIKDIYVKDSIEYVSIKTGLSPSFHFIFPITKAQENLFTQKDNKILLVVSITNLKKVDIAYEEDLIESEGTIIDSEFFTHFSGNGQIVNIIPIKNDIHQ